MTSNATLHFRRPLLQAALLLALLDMAGCASIKQHFGGDKPTPAPAAQTPAPAPAAPPAPLRPAMPLSAIINTDLRVGHYADGEQDLRQYLAQHPSDRLAQSLLKQVTADPKSMLGAQSRSYVVKPGDSYSTLASRYLGDGNRFVVLARYNGSANPSTLRVGETIHLPASAPNADALQGDATVVPPVATAGGDTPVTSVAAPTIAPTTAPDESPTAHAQRLQGESNTLLKQGQKEKALACLDEALNLNPKLAPDGNQTLRQQLLDSYHERAIVLYRDQKLDQAIALWDHVLAIDPHYERAVIYRARAQDLKNRLQQL